MQWRCSRDVVERQWLGSGRGTHCISTVHSSPASAAEAKSASTACGIMPGKSCEPVIVKVFPLPVAPYAKQQALRPFSTSGTSAPVVSWNASSCVTSGPRAWSKMYERSLVLSSRR